ncbi:proteoglycan 4-like [Gouania willdenowi]|uniref:proteoglycan 4-like n=1 Tax=Gouania willdenowi TaxID=441366 RepID=UPI001055CE4F|nr:proteoglycan 4-like [Gouania willdenowi]
MTWSVLLFLVLMMLLPLNRAQTTDFSTTGVTAQTTDSTTTGVTGCAGPPVLCCPDQDNSCSRGCYCDQYCLEARDCCPDYNLTCQLYNFTDATTSSPGTSSTSTTQEATPWPPQTESSNTAVSQGNSISTTTDSDRTKTSISTHSGEATQSRTTTSSTSLINDFQTVIFHLNGNILSSHGDSEDVILEAFSNFMEQVILPKCEGCKIKITHFKPT